MFRGTPALNNRSTAPSTVRSGRPRGPRQPPPPPLPTVPHGREPCMVLAGGRCRSRPDQLAPLQFTDVLCSICALLLPNFSSRSRRCDAHFFCVEHTERPLVETEGGARGVVRAAKYLKPPRARPPSIMPATPSPSEGTPPTTKATGASTTALSPPVASESLSARLSRRLDKPRSSVRHLAYALAYRLQCRDPVCSQARRG